MSDDTKEADKESLRRAAGFLTNAEKQAQADKAAAQWAEWERDEPKRKQALAHYNSAVTPLINEWLTLAHEVAHQDSKSQLEVLESKTSTSGATPTILAMRTFHLQVSAPTHGFWTQVRAQPDARQTFPVIVGTLHITLLHTGEVTFEVAAAKQQIRTATTEGTPVQQVDRETIGDAFRKLLALLKP